MMSDEMSDDQTGQRDPSSLITHHSSLESHPSSLESRRSPLAPSLKVAVLHDWLTGMRGGEAVLEGILDALPGAELFTLFHFPGSVSQKIESRTIHTTTLQRVAQRITDYRQLLPLFPRAVREWNFRGYDLVVSSSHCVVKGADAK